MKYLDSDSPLSVRKVVRRHVESVLRDHPNRQDVLQLLGVGRTTLYRWLREWNLEGYQPKKRKTRK